MGFYDELYGNKKQTTTTQPQATSFYEEAVNSIERNREKYRKLDLIEAQKPKPQPTSLFDIGKKALSTTGKVLFGEERKLNISDEITNDVNKAKKEIEQQKRYLTNMLAFGDRKEIYKKLEALTEAEDTYNQILAKKDDETGFFRRLIDKVFAIPQLKRRIQILGELPDKYKSEYLVGAIERQKKEPLKLIVPFLESSEKALEFVNKNKPLRQALNKYVKNEPLTDNEKRLLLEHRNNSLKSVYLDSDFGSMVADTVADMPKYMLEYGILTSIGGGFLGAIPVVSKAGKIITKVPVISKILSNKLASGIAQSIINGAVGGSINVPYIGSKLQDYIIPDFYELDKEKKINVKKAVEYLDKKSNFKDALKKSYLSSIIEYTTEGLGGIVEEPLDFIKTATISKFIKKTGLTTPSALSKFLSKVGWNGVIGEVFEEEVSELLHSKVEKREYKNPFTTPEGRERLLVETLGIGAFSGIANVSDKVLQRLARRKLTDGKWDKIEAEVVDDNDERLMKNVPDVVKEEIKKRIEERKKEEIENVIENVINKAPEEPAPIPEDVNNVIKEEIKGVEKVDLTDEIKKIFDEKTYTAIEKYNTARNLVYEKLKPIIDKIGELRGEYVNNKDEKTKAKIDLLTSIVNKNLNEVDYLLTEEQKKQITPKEQPPTETVEEVKPETQLQQKPKEEIETKPEKKIETKPVEETETKPEEEKVVKKEVETKPKIEEEKKVVEETTPQKKEEITIPERVEKKEEVVMPKEKVEKVEEKEEKKKEEVNEEVKEKSKIYNENLNKIKEFLKERKNKNIYEATKSDLIDAYEILKIDYIPFNKALIEKLGNIDDFEKTVFTDEDKLHYLFVSLKGGFFTDGGILITDKEVAKDINNKFINDFKKFYKKQLIKDGVGFIIAENETNDFVNRELNEAKVPDINRAIPEGTGSLLKEQTIKISDYKPIIHLTDGENQVVLSGNYYALIKKYFPNSELRYIEGRRQPIKIFQNNQLVGAVMPILSENDKNTPPPNYLPENVEVEPESVKVEEKKEEVVEEEAREKSKIYNENLNKIKEFLKERTNKDIYKASGDEIMYFLNRLGIKFIPYDEVLIKKLGNIDNIKNRLFKKELNYLFSSVKGGFFTDGTILITDKEVAKNINDQFIEDYKFEEIKDLLKYEKNYGKAEEEINKRVNEEINNAEVLDIDRAIPKEEGTLLKEQVIRVFDNETEIYLTDGKNQTILNTDYYLFIKKYFPNSDLRYIEGNEQPIKIIQNDQLVGLVMPKLKEKELDAPPPNYLPEREKEEETKKELKKEEKSGIIETYDKTIRGGTEERRKENVGETTSRQGISEGVSSVKEVGKNKPAKIDRNIDKSGEITRISGMGDRYFGDRLGENISVNERIEINNYIEEVLKQNRELSDDEKKLLQLYSGKGGLSKKTEGAGLLDEYYTPKRLANAVIDLVQKYYGKITEKTKILEPSAGIGNFIPEKGNITAYEISDISSKILKILRKDVNVINKPFEDIFIDERGNKKQFKNDYDIVLGNPPYGEHRGKYLGLNELPQYKKYEHYFIVRGLDLLKPNGILAYIVPQSILNPKSSNKLLYHYIAKNSTILDAYRLPNGIFNDTNIGTDILILKKTEKPLDSNSEGYKRTLDLLNKGYFKTFKNKILGEVLEGKGAWGDDYIKGSLDDVINKLKGNFPDVKDVPPPIEGEEKEELEKEERGNIAVSREISKTKELEIVKSTVVGDKFLFDNSHLSKEELEIWQNILPGGYINPAYIKEKYKISSPQEFNSDIISMDYDSKLNVVYLPNILYYSGNIYDVLDRLEKLKKDGYINENQYQRQKEGLEKIKPPVIPLEKINLDPLSSFGRQYLETFKNWVDWQETQGFIDYSDGKKIIDYLENRKVYEITIQDAIKEKETRRRLALEYFSKFFLTLDKEEQTKLEEKFNRYYNGYVSPDYEKIPLFVELNKKFKNSDLKVYNIQRRGAGFLATKGVGLIAYDTGVGKTLTSVVAIGELLKRGWIKKPLIVVQKSTYLKWYKNEISQLLRGVKVNLLSNLNDEVISKLKKDGIPDNSVSLITYEGFQKLSFTEETINNISSYLQDVVADITKTTKRQKEIEKAQAKVYEGKALRGTTGEIFFESLGFDHLVVDEAHNFKNVFTHAKINKEKKEVNIFTNLRGSSSIRAVKLFYATQYILSKNNGRGVFLLTATPFSNNPIEVYSILSLMGQKYLKDKQLYNVNDFVSTFMDLKLSPVVKANNEIDFEYVIESYKNLRALQNLITEYIDYVNTDEAGIKKPIRESIEIKLRTTPLIDGILNNLQAEAVKDSDAMPTIALITHSKNATLSPYLEARYSNIKLPPFNYKNFVETSPKLKYITEMVAYNYHNLKEGNQIIYMPKAIEYYPLLVDYLVKEKNIKKEHIATITGQTSFTERDEIQEKFNAGKIRILIGSDAIKEGVDLQVYTTDLYIAEYPWRPTDLVQLYGRGHRQGNVFNKTRIHNVMIENSVDQFIFQKLETKAKRIKNIFSYKGDKVDVGDIDYEELKLALITKPSLRVKAEYIFKKWKLSSEIDKYIKEHGIYKKIYDRYKDLIELIDKEDDVYFLKKYKKSLNELKEKIKKILEIKEFDEKILKSKVDEAEKNLKEAQDKYDKLMGEVRSKLKEIEEKGLDEEYLRKAYTENAYEEFINFIRESNKTLKKVEKVEELMTGGSLGAKGEFNLELSSDVKKVEESVAKISPIELPELVEIAKSLSNNVPTIRKLKNDLLGKFYLQKGIALSKDIFKDTRLATRVLAHEIGHLIDYLPDEQVKRGNLLGRILTLRKFLQGTFSDEKGVIKNKELRDELFELSSQWRPILEGTEGYYRYRRSSRELYADAISVLLNDPALLKEKAPKFWKAFFDHLDRKEDVKKELFRIWNLLAGEEEKVFEKRHQAIKEMFKKGDEQAKVFMALNEKKKKNILQVAVEDFDRGYFLQQKFRNKVDTSKNPYYAYDGMNFTPAQTYAYVVEKVQPIIDKLKQKEVSTKDFGEFLLLNRAMNERGEMANPLGISKEVAEKQMAYLKTKLGEEKFNAMKEIHEDFIALGEDVLEYAKKNEFYSEELVNRLKLNKSYATFAVIDFLNGVYIPATIYEQKGTFREIANPFEATIVKYINVINASNKNAVRNKIIAPFKELYPDEIKPAKRRFNGKYMEVVVGKNTLITLEKGELVGYEVPEELLNIFKKHDDLYQLAFVQALSFLNNKYFKPAFTVLSIGYQTFNAPRDFFRFFKALDTYNIFTAFKYYAKAFPEAVKYGFDKKSKLALEMMKKGYLNISYFDIADKDIPVDDYILEKNLRKLGLSIYEEGKKNTLLEIIKIPYSTLKHFGSTIEALPKMAYYLYNEEKLDKLNESELGYFIRNLVGSPNFWKTGRGYKLYNNLALFSNAMVGALLSDYEMAFKNPKTRTGWWVKTIAINILPKLFALMALAGVFGKGLKELYKKIQEYLLTNYNVIPLGVDEKGRAIVLTIPQDETGRIIGGLFYLAFRKQNVLDMLKGQMKYIWEQTPSINPIFEIGGATMSYLAGKNPYDYFYGRNVLTEDEYKAGGKYSLIPFAKWIFIKSGGRAFIRLDLIEKGEDDLYHKTIKIPVVGDIVARWIRITDRGMKEELKEKVGDVEKKEAERRLKIKEDIKEIYNKVKAGENKVELLREEIQKMTKGLDKEKRKSVAKYIINRYKLYDHFQKDDVYIDQYLMAQTNEQKSVILYEMAKNKTNDEFIKIVRELKKEKLISDHTWHLFKRMLRQRR